MPNRRNTNRVGIDDFCYCTGNPYQIFHELPLVTIYAIGYQDLERVS